MNTSEPSGHGYRETHSQPQDDLRVYGDEISLRPLFRALWTYRRLIAASVSGTLLVFSLWAFVTYAFQPVERRATLEFQLLSLGHSRMSIRTVCLSQPPRSLELRY